jgi:hypothetical protein
MYNHYALRPAEQINDAIAELPVAQDWKICAYQDNDAGECTNMEKVPNFKGVKVTSPNGRINDYVYCPTPKYKIVQHAQAFRPIIEGLTLAGTKDYNFILRYTAVRAELQAQYLIKKHVGQRYANTVNEAFKNESADLWGLYNALTSVASHDISLKESGRQKLLSKAAEMLTQELEL